MPIALLDERDKAELQKQIIDSLIKNTQSGEAVALTDISPIEHILGVKARSKNILPYPYQEPNLKDNRVTHKGITFTVNDDKSITISGINDGTGSSYFRFVRNASMKVNNCFLSGGISTTCYIRATNTESVRYGDDNGYGLYVDNVELSSITLMISSGSDYTTPVTIYPQLEEGTAKTPFTPPVDVSTASVKKYGKNLFDESIFQTLFGSLPKTSFEETETEYIIQGKNLSKNYTPNIRFKENTQYTFRYTAKQTGGNPRFQIKYTDGSFENAVLKTEYSEIVLTSVANKTVDRISGTWGSGDYYIHILKGSIQLEEGATATEYEPYKEPTTHTPNTDGTVEGVTSIYPTTTIVCDTEGVVLDVEYNADTKKYIDNKLAEMAAAIVNS